MKQATASIAGLSRRAAKGWVMLAGVLALTWVGSVSAANSEPEAVAADNSLFAQMGGGAKLKSAVNELIPLLQGDDRVNFTFADTDLTKFKQLLYDQLCALAGGPCKYTGRDMREAHAKLNITDAQFNALAEDLYIALDKVRVPYRLQNKLVAMLAPMERDIVKPGFVPENGPTPTSVR